MKINPLAANMCLPGLVAQLALAIVPTLSAQVTHYTDLQDVVNPPWATVRAGLPTNGSSFPGPVYGSTIDVNNAAVETGPYGNRQAGGGIRLHVPCNTSTTNLSGFTRWYQKESGGKTQVFRLFVNDQNTVGSRVGASRVEAFNTANSWNYINGRTYEWTGRFTIAKRPPSNGFCIFQAKNNVNDWSVQLFVRSNGSLVVNQRELPSTSDPVVYANVDRRSFDAKIQDDGRKYKVWIDGQLRASGSYSRPESITRFRWGMYFGSNVVSNSEAVVLVSGANVTSVAGVLP